MRPKTEFYMPKKGEPFYYPLLFLLYAGYYPNLKIFHDMKEFLVGVYLIFVLHAFNSMPTLLHMIFVLRDNLEVDLSMDIFILICAVTIFIDLYRFSSTADSWSVVFKRIVNTKTYGTPRDFPLLIKKMEKYSKLTLFYSLLSGVLYFAIAQVQGKICRRLNEEKGLHEVCGTISPIWLPENSRENKLLVNGVNIFMMIPNYAIITGCLMVCMIVFESSCLLRAKFHHLNELLKHVFDENNDKLKLKRLSFCIQYHLEIIRTAENFGEMLTKTMGHASLTTAALIAFSVHSVVSSATVSLVILLTGYLSATFVLCYCGQMIIDESYSVADGVYSSEWYFQRAHLMKLCNLIIMRSRKPVLIKTFPFSQQTHALFLNLIQGGYSYVTLLSTKK